MIGLPSRDIVEQLRKSYPQGTRVELINMTRHTGGADQHERSLHEAEAR